MIRLKVRVCRGDLCQELAAIANSGFIGVEPEVALPEWVCDSLLANVGYVEVDRRLADGSIVKLRVYRMAVDVYVVTEDRVVGPVTASVYRTRANIALLNDKLLGKLGIVALDFGEGLWCFRDEVGYRVRRSV